MSTAYTSEEADALAENPGAWEAALETVMQGGHFTILRDGEPVAVIVPFAWYEHKQQQVIMFTREDVHERERS